MADEKVSITISADSAEALKAFETLNQSMAKTDDKIKKMGGSFKDSFLIFGAAFAGISAAIKKTTDAFAESEKSATMLAQALKNTGNYSQAAMNDLNGFAASLQKVTAFEDDSIIAAQSLIAAQGYHGQVLKDVTKATLDLATAKGMDLQSAANLVAKSIGTENNVLARYGVEINGAADSTQRAYSAVKSISDMWGGMALAQGRTYAGQMEILKNTIGDVQEKIGKLLVPMVLKVSQLFRDGVVAVGNFATEHGKLFVTLVAGVGAFTGLAAAAAGIAKIMPMLTAAFALITSPIGIAIAAIIGLVIVIENWGTISVWLKDAWNNTIVYLANLWQTFSVFITDKTNQVIETLKYFGQIVWDVMTGQYKEALTLSQEAIAGYTEGAATTFDDYYNNISSGLSTTADFMGNIYDNIKNKITSTINSMTSSWKGGLDKQKKDTQDTANAELSVWQQHWTQSVLSKDLSAKKQMEIDKDISNSFAMAASLMNSKQRDLFEVGKAAAIANAIVMGYFAIVNIWSHMPELGLIVGPIVAGILTAMVAGVTATNIAAISATNMPAAEFGGIIPGSSSGMPVLAGENNKSEAIIPLEGEGSARLGMGSTVINLNIQNMFSEDREAVRRLARDLDEELENRRQSRSSAFAHGILAQAAIG